MSTGEWAWHLHLALQQSILGIFVWFNHFIEKSKLLKNRYKKGKDYNYDIPGFGQTSGQFTQLVWKSTTDVGCARCGAKVPNSPKTETYVVCKYKPQGNIRGDYPTNVFNPDTSNEAGGEASTEVVATEVTTTVMETTKKLIVKNFKVKN